MKRREFLTGLCGATAAIFPLAARAQQAATPSVGFVHAAFPRGFAEAVAGLRQGLAEAGYVEGRNLTIEYRWGEGRYDRLQEFAADLIHRKKVAVIFASSPPAVRAIMAETKSVPIVFAMGEDPLKEGLVTSLGRPAGNVTGFSWFANQVFGKRLALLTDVASRGAAVAFLVNPDNPNSEPDIREMQSAATQSGRPVQILTARSEHELETAFAAMVERKVGALLVGVDGFFLDRREFIIALAARNAIPAIYDRRQYPDSGGLMSYGASQIDAWRNGGSYIGRILRGEKPGDLPVQQSTKFELVVNMKTAKALGLTFSPTLHALATEVIE
jgi:putative ABC transport system substrate-binding protein